MAQVTITFLDPVTDTEMQDTTVDDQWTVQKLVADLIGCDFIKPVSDPTKHYVLHVKGKMELNDDSKRLADANVTNGDVIRVVVAQRGGRL